MVPDLEILLQLFVSLWSVGCSGLGMGHLWNFCPYQYVRKEGGFPKGIVKFSFFQTSGSTRLSKIRPVFGMISLKFGLALLDVVINMSDGPVSIAGFFRANSVLRALYLIVFILAKSHWGE